MYLLGCRNYSFTSNLYSLFKNAAHFITKLCSQAAKLNADPRFDVNITVLEIWFPGVGISSRPPSVCATSKTIFLSHTLACHDKHLSPQESLAQTIVLKVSRRKAFWRHEWLEILPRREAKCDSNESNSGNHWLQDWVYPKVVSRLQVVRQDADFQWLLVTTGSSITPWALYSLPLKWYISHYRDVITIKTSILIRNKVFEQDWRIFEQLIQGAC